MLFIDLYVTDHRRGKITLKASLIWSGVWIFTALLFNLFLYFYLESGHQKAIEFLTGYIIEKSLSVDNLFVFLMIFSVMDIKPENQPHILKWGILSAIVFRIIFIFAGVALINLFHPIIYVFAIILLLAAYKMAFGGEQKIDVENNWLIKISRKYFKLNTAYEGKKFFIKVDKKVYITTTFLTLLLIESSDIVFAVDSIPAIIAITNDTFIIISSNIFAILGLRALYFALAGLVDLFVYLKYGVAIILFYVGIKMLISEFYKIPTEISLVVILIFLGGSIVLSLIKRNRFSQ
ncbi:MAG: TerC/Alx family metal homeostasis membrane protein [Ignavibacteriales bacterium]|nr:TerC/Alx family metal homeostasis membrane protein [Ignavibacterium sp.]RPI60591.1 MAG: TerC/Alx family metal homeostasis membrane protein [Ignavibacteriales bacterium]